MHTWGKRKMEGREERWKGGGGGRGERGGCLEMEWIFSEGFSLPVKCGQGAQDCLWGQNSDCGSWDRM